MHDHHEVLPGFDPDRILQDGCAECEARGKNPIEAIVHLDPERLARAWVRAAEWQRDRLDPRRPVSAAEAPMLETLWAVQLVFERSGVAPLGQLPRGKTLMDALAEEEQLYPIRVLQHHANDPDSDLNNRITMLERQTILAACDRALR